MNFDFNEKFPFPTAHTQLPPSLNSVSPLMKRVSTYSGDTKRATVRAYKDAERQLHQNPPEPISPMSIASAASGGAPARTIRNWLKEDLSPEQIRERVSRGGRSRVISEDQEHLLVGYFIDMRLSLTSVSRADLVSFADRYFNITISPQRISEILERNDITLQIARQRCSRMVSEEVVEDSVEFVEEVRERKLPDSRVIVMDETGLWSNVTTPKTFSFKNWFGIPHFLKFTFLSFFSYC